MHSLYFMIFKKIITLDLCGRGLSYYTGSKILQIRQRDQLIIRCAMCKGFVMTLKQNLFVSKCMSHIGRGPHHYSKGVYILKINYNDRPHSIGFVVVLFSMYKLHKVTNLCWFCIFYKIDPTLGSPSYILRCWRHQGTQIHVGNIH